MPAIVHTVDAGASAPAESARASCCAADSYHAYPSRGAETACVDVEAGDCGHLEGERITSALPCGAALREPLTPASHAQDTGLPQKRPRASEEQEEEPPVKSLGLLAQYGSDEDDA